MQWLACMQRAAHQSMCQRLAQTTTALHQIACWYGVRQFSWTGYQPLLLREYIHQSLYHPEHGYFTQQRPPLRRLPEPINFPKLLNHTDYLLALDRIYNQLEVDWLTPAEIFRPWFGQGIAKYMLESRQHTWALSGPLQVVEVGGGTGTLAASILDYIAEKDPIAYSSMSYCCLEISPTLARMQRNTVIQESGHTGEVFASVVADAATAEAWQQAAEVATRRANSSSSSSSSSSKRLQEQHCFVLMMEVLDNLPHDRVVRSSEKNPWMQTLAVPASQQTSNGSSSSGSSSRQQPQWEEQVQPLTDPLVQRCLAAVAPGGPDATTAAAPGRRSWLQQLATSVLGEGPPLEIYLPTSSLQLLEQLHAARPCHTLLAGDFDALPDVVLSGRNAPLVSGRSAPGKPKDYDTLYIPWGSADIFFPTDFDALGRLYKVAKDTASTKQRESGLGTALPSLSGARSAPSPPPLGAARSTERQQAVGEQHLQGGLDGTGSSTGNGDGSSPADSSSSSEQSSVTCRHLATADFMSAFVGSKVTRTLSGYNPLLQDWTNTRIFEGHSGVSKH